MQRRARKSVRAVRFSEPVAEYTRAMTELDLFRGPRGRQTISPRVKPLLSALHQVLAGGKVDVRAIPVSGSIDKNTVRRLNQLAQKALDDANKYNRLDFDDVSYG